MTGPNESVFPYGQMDCIQPEYGLTKREWMATQILAGIASQPWRVADSEAHAAIKAAVIQADLLIAELNKPATGGAA